MPGEIKETDNGDGATTEVQKGRMMSTPLSTTPVTSENPIVALLRQVPSELDSRGSRVAWLLDLATALDNSGLPDAEDIARTARHGAELVIGGAVAGVSGRRLTGAPFDRA